MATKQLVSLTGKQQILAPIHPSVAIEIAYQRKLEAIIKAMHRSILCHVAAIYRTNPPAMAQDVTIKEYGAATAMQQYFEELGKQGTFEEGGVAEALQQHFEELSKQWIKNFDEAAPAIAKHFATAVTNRADGALMASLKKAGWTIKFRLDEDAKEVLRTVIGDNVRLIKSIAPQHLKDVEGLVMESVARGGDHAFLVNELVARYGLTRQRAALISRDQNSKANAAILRARWVKNGIEEAVWMHCHGGNKPRPTHLANDRKRYKVKDGWYDPAEGRNIFPGELINCGCVAGIILPGFD
jgi:uncharacterized protein with gpF-like domain